MDFEQQLATFSAEREALLLRSDASRADWQRFTSEWVGRIPWDSLDVGQIVAAISAGLTDVPTGVERASARLDTLAVAPTSPSPSTDDLTVVRIAAARLRLVRGQEPAVQSARLKEFLAEPALPRLARSPYAAEVLDALFAVERSDVLRPQSARLRDLLTQIDVQAAPAAIVGRADRVVLLIPVTFTDLADRDAVRRYWLESLQHARAAAPPEQTPLWREADRAIRRLEADLTPAAVQPTTSETFLASDTGIFLWDMLLLSAFADARFDMTSRPLRSQPDSVFPYRGAGPERRSSVSAAGGAIAKRAEGTPIALRAFDGFILRDSSMTFRAGDLGVRVAAPASGFARGLTLEAGAYRISTDRIQVNRDAADAAGITFAMASGGLRIAEIRARQIDLSPSGPDPRALNIRTLTVHALGMRLLTIRGFRYRMGKPAEEAPEVASEPTPVAEKPQEPTKEETPPGFSKPSLMSWLRIPTVGIEEGGITFGYSNAVKIRPRWTADVALRTFTVRSPYISLAFNYNLLGVTPSADRFLDFNDLRENSIGSFYFRVTNQDVTEDNDTLFHVKQIVGVEHVERKTYARPNSNDIDTVNIPFGTRYERVDFRDRTFGLRTSAAMERIEAPTLSGVANDDRASLALITGPPTTRISRGLNLTLRGEGTGYRSIRGGSGQPYSWYRGILGLSTLLWPGVRLSAASVTSGESGSTPYPYEKVPAGESMNLRADTTIGSVYLGLLDSYDIPSGRFTRFQALVSYSVGIFEPYLRYDQRGSSIGFGIFTKIEPYLARFGKRKVERLDAVPQAPTGY
jgi:hypothetical protein